MSHCDIKVLNAHTINDSRLYLKLQGLSHLDFLHSDIGGIRYSFLSNAVSEHHQYCYLTS